MRDEAPPVIPWLLLLANSTERQNEIRLYRFNGFTVFDNRHYRPRNYCFAQYVDATRDAEMKTEDELREWLIPYLKGKR